MADETEISAPDTKLRWEVLLFAGAVVVAAIAMVIDRPTAPLELDEHVAFWIADPSGTGTLWERSLDVSATPPLFSWLQQLGLTGEHAEWKFRLPSWIAFVLAICFVFATGCRMGGVPVGAIASLALALHPESLDLMRLARPYAFSVFFAAVNLFALVGVFRLEPTPIRWGLLIASQGALIWVHYLNVPLVITEDVLLFLAPHVLRSPQNSSLPRIGRSVGIVTAVLAAATTLPLLPGGLRMLDWSPYLNYRTESPVLSNIIHPFWWVAIPVGLASALLIPRTNGTEKHLHVSCSNLTGLLVLSLMPSLLLAAGGYFFQAALAAERYRAVCAPASSLLLACLVYRSGRFGPALAVTIGGLTLAWWFSGDVPWKSERLGTPAAQDWADLAKELNTSGREGEPVFVYSGLIESRLVPAIADDALLMDYVSSRLGRFYVTENHPRSALPWTWIPTPPLNELYHTQLSRARESGQAVWLAAATDTDLARETAAVWSVLAEGEGFVRISEYRRPNAVLIRFEAH